MRMSMADLNRQLANNTDIKLVDGSYGPSFQGHDAKTVWQNMRIDEAVYFDIDDIADPDSEYTHMLPDADLFADKVGRLGICETDTVVIYGQQGVLMGPARVWWMFKTFGHQNVYLLDGSLAAWHSAGFPVNQTLPKTPDFKGYKPQPEDSFINAEFILSQALRGENDTPYLVVDARPAPRFTGQLGEPRPGMRSGHIPNSINIPAMELIDPITGGLKPVESLKPLLAPCGEKTKFIVSCGSGVTACVVAFALKETHSSSIDARIYDASWSEWGRQDKANIYPVESG